MRRARSMGARIDGQRYLRPAFPHPLWLKVLCISFQVWAGGETYPRPVYNRQRTWIAGPIFKAVEKHCSK